MRSLKELMKEGKGNEWGKTKTSVLIDVGLMGVGESISTQRKIYFYVSLSSCEYLISLGLTLIACVMGIIIVSTSQSVGVM